MNEPQDTTRSHKPRRHSKTARVLILITAIAVAVGGTIALAGGKHGGDWNQGDRMAFMLDRMTDRLDLSEAQQAKVESILTASRNESEPYRAELATLRSDMRALVEADEFYADQVRIKLESKASAMVELGMIAARTMHDVRAQLTPEQRAEADELLQKFADKSDRRSRGHKRHQHSGAPDETEQEDS
jgi:Spy/CpxP family protein refolding chaperone